MKNRITTAIALLLIFFSFFADGQNIEKRYKKAIEEAIKKPYTKESIQAIHDYYLPKYKKIYMESIQKTKHIGIGIIGLNII